MKPLVALARADVRMYLGNRKALAITLAAPILIAAFFGSVFGGPPKKPSKVPIAVTDLDASPVSAKIVAAIRGDSTFEVRALPEAEAVALVREGKVRAATVIPAGFGKAASGALFRPDRAKPEIAVHYDPSQAVTLSLLKGLLAQHVMSVVGQESFSGTGSLDAIVDARRELQDPGMDPALRRDLDGLFDSLERLRARDAERARTGETGGALSSGPFSMPFATKEVAVTSGTNRRYNAFAHSFAGMGVQFILFMGIELGIGLLLMRRQGLWKRLRTAPLTRATLLGSKVASGTVIALVLLAGIYAAAIALFGVRIEGSVAGFALIAIAFGLLTATFGLLIAALGRTPEATRGIAIVATLLLVMLGGAWVPTFVFPEWLQAATLAVPTRWAIDGLAAMTWRGLGFEAALAPVGVLLAFSATFLAVAVARFRWEE